MENHHCNNDDRVPGRLEGDAVPGASTPKGSPRSRPAAESEEGIESAFAEQYDDAISKFLQVIQKTKMLTAAQERELIANVNLGNRCARDQLIVANQRLVMNVVKRYVNRRLPFLDVIEAGNLGLITAVERYDLSRDCRFSTYATWWIKQSIERALANPSRAVRRPVQLAEDIDKINRATYELRKKINREPALAEVAGNLEAELNHIRKLLALLKKTEAFDRTASKDAWTLGTS